MCKLKVFAAASYRIPKNLKYIECYLQNKNNIID